MMDSLPEASLRNNLPKKPVSSKSSIGKSNYRKKSGNSDKWTNILSSIARQVSTEKPLKISGLMIRGGDESSIKHLISLLALLNRLKKT